MPEFTQQTFLGASISSFSANFGFNSESSELSVTLVEDNKNITASNPNGDFFLVPKVGSPLTFTYDDFIFDGILNAHRTRASTSNNPIYEVDLVDPRVILEGVELILDGYADQVFGTPNLFNVFGFLEDRDGFGGAGVNSSGMVWK